MKPASSLSGAGGGSAYAGAARPIIAETPNIASIVLTTHQPSNYAAR
jgi:hypothetical protein